MLSREDIETALTKWKHSWNSHDLNGVVDLFHEDILFENWDGTKVLGKRALRNVWKPWFDRHGGFTFLEEDTFIDELNQKVLFRWTLEWPSVESNYKNRPERRRGLDILHFKEGKIFRKYTYSKTFLEIEGKSIRLVCDQPHS
jgi:hypothetical protein